MMLNITSHIRYSVLFLEVYHGWRWASALNTRQMKTWLCFEFYRSAMPLDSVESKPLEDGKFTKWGRDVRMAVRHLSGNTWNATFLWLSNTMRNLVGSRDPCTPGSLYSCKSSASPRVSREWFQSCRYKSSVETWQAGFARLHDRPGMVCWVCCQ